MKKHTIASDAISRRVIEEISFQASILALQAGIESANRAGTGTLTAAGMEDESHSLVRRGRRPPEIGERLRRPDPRGL